MANTSFSRRAPNLDGVVAMPARNMVDRVLRFPHLSLLKIGIDIALILLAAGWAWLASFGQIRNHGPILPFLTVVLCGRLFLYFALKLHHGSWLHVSRFEVLALALSAVLGPPLIALLLWILPEPFTLRALVRPHFLLSTEPAFYLLLMFAARITTRAVASTQKRGGLKRLLVVGAGDAARGLAYQIQESRSEYRIVGFLDDDARRHKRLFHGLPVLGATGALERVVREHEVQEVVIAISDLEPAKLRELLSLCEASEVPARILPPLSEMIGARPDWKSLREVRMEDLLPRPEVKIDFPSLARHIGGRTVLVTGGGGSIGSELCRQIRGVGARRILVLGRGENSVFEITQELTESASQCASECEIVPIIASVCERGAMEQIFERYEPQIVFHAAAHKHVPLMERHPCEAVRNNVLGTLNVVQLAVERGVEHFVLVSTDKAVEPANVMGATKRVCEMIVTAHAARSGLNMVSVRFGNVLGSRGSVVTTMTRQIRRGGPVTVTDPQMLRYFMTIPEAVQLILQATTIGGCGNVFILDMGHPVKILDLAHDLIRLCGLVPNHDIPIHITGRRPGEKLKEDVLSLSEIAHAERNGPFYKARAETVALEELLPQLEDLRRACQQGNDARVMQSLKHIVPNFQPDAVAPESPTKEIASR